MELNIYPVRPVANQKSSSDRFTRGQRRNPSGFAGALAAAMGAREWQDGFVGNAPRHEGRPLDEAAELLRRVREVNHQLSDLFFS